MARRNFIFNVFFAIKKNTAGVNIFLRQCETLRNTYVLFSHYLSIILNAKIYIHCPSIIAFSPYAMLQ